ncbi:hypothetical protein ACA910_009802 [Epithemia clementina (nom. ined.)]
MTRKLPSTSSADASSAHIGKTSKRLLYLALAVMVIIQLFGVKNARLEAKKKLTLVQFQSGMNALMDFDEKTLVMEEDQQWQTTPQLTTQKFVANKTTVVEFHRGKIEKPKSPRNKKMGFTTAKKQGARIVWRAAKGTDFSAQKPMRVLKSDYEYSNSNTWSAQPFILEQYKLIFFSTAKVSCTTWRILFRKMMGYDFDEAKNNSTICIHDPRCNGLKRLGDYDVVQATAIMNSPNWTRAIFLRDPIERFLSAYLNKGLQNDYIIRRCCRKGDATCKQMVLASAESAFPIMKRCNNDEHWITQSKRISPKYMQQINFIGRIETVQEDSEALLRRIGAWETFGQTGWGPNGTDPIFKPRSKEAAGNKKPLEPQQKQQKPVHTGNFAQGKHMIDGQNHATHARDKLTQHITPKLYGQLLEYYHEDYENPWFNFSAPKLFDN